MSILSMPALPDCGLCGGPVSLEVDEDRGALEVCVRCGNAHAPRPVLAGIRAQARQVVAQARREGLPVMQCPSCKQGRHDRCHASGCECTDGAHPRRPSADA